MGAPRLAVRLAVLNRIAEGRQPGRDRIGEGPHSSADHSGAGNHEAATGAEQKRKKRNEPNFA